MKKRSVVLLLVILLAFRALALPALAETALPKKGDVSAEVQYLQMRLQHLGYPVGTIDADYGKKTTAAVKNFQKARGLSATGTVDRDTWDALYDEHIRISRDGYEADVKLTPPFTHLESDSGSTREAWVVLGDVRCAAGLVWTTTMADLIASVQSYYRDTLYRDSEEKYGAADFDMEVQEFTLYEREAATLTVRFTYVLDGKKLQATMLWGAAVLAQDGDRLLCARCNLRANTETGQQGLLAERHIRDLLASVTLTASPEPAQADPITGAWYALEDNRALLLMMLENGYYRIYLTDGTVYAGGVWTNEGGQYRFDNGNMAVTLDGDSLTLGEGGLVFGRTPVEEPELEAAESAAQEDYIGTWTAVGLYMCDGKGLPVGEDVLGGDEITAAVDADGLTLRGLSKEDERYTYSFDGAALAGLTPVGREHATFDGASMLLLSDGTAEIYVPGESYLALILEKR